MTSFAKQLTCIGLSVAGLSFPFAAHAQSRGDSISLSETIIGGSTVDETGKSTHAESTEIRVGTPPAELGGGVLLLGSAYARRMTFHDNDPTERDSSLHLYDISIGGILIAPLSPRWSLSLIPVIGVSTTFDADFDLGKDVTVSGVAMASYAIGGDRRFTVGFGLIASNTLSFFPVIPVASLAYRVPPWRIELAFPQPSIVRSLGDRFEVGISFLFDLRSYRIEPYTVAGQTKADYFAATQFFAGAQAGVHLGAGFWLTAKGGVVFDRSTELRDGGRDGIDGSSLSSGAAPYGTFVLSWRGPPPPVIAPALSPAEEN